MQYLLFTASTQTSTHSAEQQLGLPQELSKGVPAHSRAAWALRWQIIPKSISLEEGARRRGHLAQAETNPARSQIPGAVWGQPGLWSSRKAGTPSQRSHRQLWDEHQEQLLAKEALQHLFNISQLHQRRQIWHHFHFALDGYMRSTPKKIQGMGRNQWFSQWKKKQKAGSDPSLVPKPSLHLLPNLCHQLNPSHSTVQAPLTLLSRSTRKSPQVTQWWQRLSSPIKIQHCNCL